MGFFAGFNLPRELIDHICEYDVPLRDVVEDIQNRLEHYIHSMRHFHRTVYRYTKFVNQAVQKEVENWYSLEEIFQARFRLFLEDFHDGFQIRLESTGYDSIGKKRNDMAPLMDALMYIRTFHSSLQQFKENSKPMMIDGQ